MVNPLKKILFSNRLHLSIVLGIPTSRILLRPALRDYGGQVAPTYAKASAGKHGAVSTAGSHDGKIIFYIQKSSD